MDRIEIEPQEPQLRHGSNHRDKGEGDDPDPVALEKPVHRRECGKPHRVRLAGRLEDRE